jgi:hypothetical protein
LDSCGSCMLPTWGTTCLPPTVSVSDIIAAGLCCSAICASAQAHALCFKPCGSIHPSMTASGSAGRSCRLLCWTPHEESRTAQGWSAHKGLLDATPAELYHSCKDPNRRVCICVCMCACVMCAVGGIMGFALVFGGGSAVQWATPDPKSFPPVKVRSLGVSGKNPTVTSGRVFSFATTTKPLCGIIRCV